MQTSPDPGDRSWHVLNYIRKAGRPSPQSEIEVFNRDGERLELFAPVIRPAHMVNGRVVYRDRLLTYYYIFVKGTLDDVKALCSSPHNDLSLMLNRGSESRYATLTDEEMRSFRIIARAYTNTIPFFNITDIDLEEGDTVEVVGGEFSGLRGTFIPRSRSNRGNLVIAATADMGAVVWDIEAKYIRILEFAPLTHRQYDILDSFIPRLLPILRKFHAQENLTEREKSQLAVFNRRMGVVAPVNHKVEAKLLATLMAVQTITGDSDGYRSSSRRFERRRTAVTNPWTQALIELMLSVSRDDLPRLQAAYASVRDITGHPTNTQRQLLSEFRHYLTLQ